MLDPGADVCRLQCAGCVCFRGGDFDYVMVSPAVAAVASVHCWLLDVVNVVNCVVCLGRGEKTLLLERLYCIYEIPVTNTLNLN